MKLTCTEPMGLERLKEALETNDWEGADELDPVIDLGDLDVGDNDEDAGSIGFGIDPTEMADEMAGMKRAIYGGSLGEDSGGEEEAEDDDEVEKMQAMMLKLQAVRGKSHAGSKQDLANRSRSRCRFVRSREKETCRQDCQRNNENNVAIIVPRAASTGDSINFHGLSLA